MPVSFATPANNRANLSFGARRISNPWNLLLQFQAWATARADARDRASLGLGLRTIEPDTLREIGYVDAVGTLESQRHSTVEHWLREDRPNF